MRNTARTLSPRRWVNAILVAVAAVGCSAATPAVQRAAPGPDVLALAVTRPVPAASPALARIEPDAGSVGGATTDLWADLREQLDPGPGECFGSWQQSWPPDARRLAGAARVGTGWLEPGQLFVGELESAAAAFEAYFRTFPDLEGGDYVLMGRGANGAVIRHDGADGTPIGGAFLAVSTTDGVEVWWLARGIGRTTCG